MEQKQANQADKEIVQKNLERQSIDAPASTIEDFKEFFKKQDEGYVITLPNCNLNVRVSTPDIVNMVVNDQIPQELITVALQLKGVAPKQSVDDMDTHQLKKMVKFLDRFAADTIVYPKFTTDPENEPDKLPVSKLDLADKLFLVELINRGVKALSSFRGEQTK